MDSAYDAGSVNAPLDPFGREPLNAEMLTSLFKFLKGSWVMSMTGALPRHEQLLNHDCFFTPESPPLAVIFISHRWESGDEPDPSGRQADAIRYFLSQVRDIHLDIRKRRFFRGPRVESLSTYGVLHAAYFYDMGLRFCGCSADDWKAELEYSDPQEILNRIGIWYDYSSLPQDNISQCLTRSLARIHELISQSTMLILRFPSDNYEDRLWCALELSVEPGIERRRCKRISLHALFVGTQIHRDYLMAEHGVMNWLGMWAKRPAQALQGVRLFYDLQFMLRDEDREIPLYTTRRPPYIFRAQRDLMVFIMERFAKLSAEDVRLGSVECDIVSLILNAAEVAGLKTAHENDRAFTCLMILYARHRGAPEIAGMYSECIRRMGSGGLLSLRRYRELRTMDRPRVWYVFSDSEGPEDPPEWAVDCSSDSPDFGC